MNKKPKAYEPPKITLERKMTFPMTLIVASGHGMPCRQCSSCHNCR